MISRTTFITLCLAGLVSASPAWAEERAFCADRPGLDTPTCTLAPGAVMLEIGLAGWEHSASATESTNSLGFGGTELRIGVADRAEVQIGFDGFVHERVADKVRGSVANGTTAGDMTLGFRRNLSGIDGPIALQASVSLPVGKSPAGAGDWGASLVLPMEFELPGKLQFALGPQIDAAVNGSGLGRHLAFGTVAAISLPLGSSLSLTAEFSAMRDRDPQGHQTNAIAGLALAWMVGRDFQIDAEFAKGAAGDVPGNAVMIGFARKLR